MLSGINPALTADILHALASMGHGDELVICDANFPATSIAAHTVMGAHIESGVDAISMLDAVLSVVPIDQFDLEICPVRSMQVVDAPDEVPEIVAEAKSLTIPKGSDIDSVERHAFYQQAREAFVIIRTSETRFYGNFILRKGTVSSS